MHCLAVIFYISAGCGQHRNDTQRIYEQRFMLTGAESVAVDLAIGPGVYRAQLMEEAIDVKLQVVEPDLQAEGTLRRHGRQSVVITADQPMQLHIRIHGRDVRQKSGSAVLALDRLTSTTSEQATRVAAETLLATAYRKSTQGAVEASDEAAVALSEAAELLEDVSEPDSHLALLELARLRYAKLDDWEGAEAAASAVSRWAKENNDQALAARADVIHAAALMERAQGVAETPGLFDKAQKLLEGACGVFDVKSLRLDQAECVNNLGLLEDYRGRYDAASRTYARAVTLFIEAGDPFGEAKARQNMATVEYLSGHLSPAIEQYTQVLPLLDPQVQTDLYAAVINNLATASAIRGDFQRALELHNQSLAIYRQMDRKLDIARALYGLGATYSLAGDPERALPFFEQALPISRGGDNARAVRATLQAMGNALSDLGRYPEALQRQRESMKFATTPASRVLAILAIARIEGEVGQIKAATARLQTQLDEVEDPILRARINSELARLELKAGRWSSSETIASGAAKALEQYELGAAAADAYATAAEAQLRSGRAAAASVTLDNAVRLGRERNRRIWSPDLRASNTASQRRIHDLQLSALISQGNAETDQWRNFWIADSFKAQSLLRERRQRAPSIDATNSRSEAQLRLSELQLRVEFILANSSAPDRRVPALLDEIRQLRVDLDTAPSGWQAVDRDERSSAEEYRQQLKRLLPPHGTLVSYHLGNPHSYAWVVSQERISQVQLPSRDVIARAVDPWISALRGSGKVTPRAENCGAAIAKLVLQPIIPLLEGERLWIVPDAEVTDVPFAMLPVASGCAELLVDRFTLSYLPSARFALAVAASPVSLAGKQVALIGETAFAADAVSGLPTLPATKSEVQNIAASLSSWQSTVLTGENATRARVLGLPFGELSVLHLATHAQVRVATPELSALYVSDSDVAGSPSRSQITVADIRNYGIHADLVVLSACETSLGRSIVGEGPIGLTHAFLAAGARAVIASDRRVADQSTADLMKDFYLEFAAGTDAATALTTAQRRARVHRKSGYASQDWAAFRIIGGLIAPPPSGSSSSI